MLTKYCIEIDGVKAEVPKGCLKNWDEIKCVYKRSDFSGVTRSFTTQFEFVGEIYDRLMALYLRDGVNARAAISLYTITNEWAWEEQFTCDLDFSSIEWDNHIIKINCIDDSLASAIKARKGTKYEFVVGQDIPVADTLEYDRITMQNSCVHEIMGNSTEGSSDVWLLTTGPNPQRLSTYLIKDSESYENSPVLYQDENEEDGSCFIEIVTSTDNIEFETEIRVKNPDRALGSVSRFKVYLMAFDKDDKKYSEESYVKIAELVNFKSNDEQARTYLGLFPSFGALKHKYPIPPDNSWALVGEKYETAKDAYISSIGDNDEWIQTTAVDKIGTNYEPVRPKRCPMFVFKKRIKIAHATAGTCYGLFYEHSSSPQYLMKISSSIRTHWKSRANSIAIDALSPKTTLNALMNRICDNKLNIDVQIKDTDGRLAKTYLFAAESIRNISGAKLYTSFNDFCDWMEAVFGYTYYLGDRKKARFGYAQEFAMQWELDGDHLLHTPCPGGYGSQVLLIQGTPYFAVLGDDINADGTNNFYTKWQGSDEYNDPITGKARLDTVFYDEYYMGCYFDSSYNLHKYSGDVFRCVLDSQMICFVPRAELFAGNNVVKLTNIRDLEFSINTAIAYSALTIGYEKQEYEAECGRDEWNFSARYTTGVDKFEKKLSLISKYRADCYGFEFLSQERAKDTKDNKSDNTVFFAYCSVKVEEEESEGSRGDEETEITQSSTLKIDRSGSTIYGALSSDVFNGEYAPYLCAKANAAYIAAAMCPMTLKFASFDGNTDICIDGIQCNADLQLNEQLFTLGEVGFSSADVDTELDVNALYEVHSNGITYRGFLKEVSFKYAKAETVKYKLIVKEIEL